MKISLLIKKIVCVCLIFALNISNNFLHETQKINKVYADELINLDIPAWDGETIAESFADGTGTVDDPYQISNGEELAFFADVINNNLLDENGISYNNNHNYFELTNDIDLANKEWTPIGNSGAAVFTSSYFNGNGYKIYNLAMTTTEDLGYYGLFGNVYNGSIIHDIDIINCNINVNTNKSAVYIGALACEITNNSSIYNCSASGTITVTRPSGTSGQSIYIGGLCGKIQDMLSLENCKSDVDINFINFSTDGNSVIIGGVVGYYEVGTITNIDNCSYTGNIEVTNDLVSLIVGGLVGELYAYNGDGFTLSNSYFVGNITVQNCGDVYIGGLFGLSYSPVELNNCFSSCNIVAGEINGTSDAAIGGLIGIQYNTCNITNCYSAHGSILIDSTDEYSYVGGLIGDYHGDDGNTNSLTNCYSGNIVEVSSPTTPGNIGSFVGTTNAPTISNCYFDKDLSGYVSTSESINATNIIGLTADQMTGYSALENMSGLFEVTGSNTAVAFDIPETFDINIIKYYYSHYPQLKIFFNSNDENVVHHSELSTRARVINIIDNISDIQTDLNDLYDNINENFLSNQNEINNINQNFSQEFSNIKRNQSTLENKINAIFMKICGRPICNTHSYLNN